MVWRLAKVTIFTIPNTLWIDAENTNLINYKCVCGELNRYFCQARVSRSNYFILIRLPYSMLFSSTNLYKEYDNRKSVIYVNAILTKLFKWGKLVFGLKKFNKSFKYG